MAAKIFNKAFCEKALSEHDGDKEKARDIICDAAFGTWWKGASVKQRLYVILSVFSCSCSALFGDGTFECEYIDVMRGRGIDMNARGGHGLTMPMILAMSCDDYGDMKDFLASCKKIDLDAKSDEGISAFGYAKLLGNTGAKVAMTEYAYNSKKPSDNGSMAELAKMYDKFINNMAEVVITDREKGN